METRRKREINPDRLNDPAYLNKMFAACARASALGFAVMDSQTRYEAVNASLARENQVSAHHHIGRTCREIVGELALQIEPTYEKVLRTGKSAPLLLGGHIRDTPEFSDWFEHWFPILDRTGCVNQIGVFVVNVTAEKATAEIFDALARDPKRLRAEAAGLLDKFDESIRQYHQYLRKSLEELANPLTEPHRKVDQFRSSLQEVDDEISAMRELIYAVISHFSIPTC